MSTTATKKQPNRTGKRTGPEVRTKDELVRELAVASSELQERDRFERALKDLVAGGLLRIRSGDLVSPEGGSPSPPTTGGQGLP